MESLDAQLMNSRKRKNESEIDLLGRNSSIGIGGSGSYLATLRAVSNFQSPDQPQPSFNAFWINNQQQHHPSAFLYPPQRPYIYPPGSSCNPFDKILMPAALPIPPTPPTPLGWQTIGNSYTHLTQLQHMTSAVVDPPPPPHPWLAPPTPEKKTCCSVENRRSFKSSEHSNYHHHAFNLNQQPVFQDDFVFCTQSQTNAQKYVSFGSTLADFHPPIQGDQGLLVEADYLSLGFESQRGNRSRDINFGSGICFEEEFARNNAGDVDLTRVVSQELQRDSGSQLQSLASNDKVVHLEAVENLESHEGDKSTEQKAKRRKHRPKVIIENSSSKSTTGRKGQKPKNNATENTTSLCPQELGKECSRKCGTVTEEIQNDQGSLPQGKSMQEPIGENSHAENTQMNQGRMPEGKNIEEPVGENLHMEKTHMNQGSMPQGKNIEEPVGENFHKEKMHMNQGSMPQGKNIEEPVGENFHMEKKNMNQGSMPQGKNIEEPVGENFHMEKTHMNQGSMSHGKNIEEPVGENIHTKKWKQIKSRYGPSPAESALLKVKTSSKGKRQKTTLIPEEKKHQSGARKVRINGHSREVGLSNSRSHDGDIYGYLIQMMERLQLEERMDQLVPFVANKEMVTYEGPFHPLKKRKQRARVDLDGETHRMWRLLMGKAVSSDYLITDKDDKEMKWEEERKVFKGRADSFIARMHLVQGDRRYSHWKGSVVDSVIGAFLTQNVSDHLSSSAFMALVSRFPPVEEDKDDSHDDTEHISCSDTGDLEVLMDLNKPLDYPCVEAPDSTLDFPELSNFLDIKGNEENTQDPCKQIAYNRSDCLKVGTCLTESMEFTSEVAPMSTQKYQYQFIEKCKDTLDHNAEHLACNGSDSSETVTDLNASTTCIRPLNSSQICRDVPQCLLVRENDQDDPKCIGCNTGDASKILSNLGKPVESKCAVLPISSQKLTSKALEKTSNGLSNPVDIMSLGVHNSSQYFTGALQCPLVKENEGNSQNDSQHIACNVNEASQMDTNLSKPVEPTSIVLPLSNRQFTSKSHEEIESSYHYNAEHFTCHGSYDSDPIADLNELWNITRMGAPKSVQHAIGASQFKEDRDNSQDETSHISCNRCYASETGTNLSKHIESTCVVLPKSTQQFPGNTKDHSGTLTGNGTIGNGHEDSSNTESDCVNSLEDKEDFSTSGGPKCQTILFGKNLCAAAERGEVYAPEIKKQQSCFSSPEILRSQKGVHEIKSQNTNQHTGELEDVISAKINQNKYFTTLLNQVVEGGNKKSSANFVSCSDSLLEENNIRATTLINAAEEIEISSITEEDMMSSFKGSVHGKDFRKHSIGIRENEYVAASFGPLPEKNTFICQESLDTPDAIRCLEHSEQYKPYDVSKGNKNSLRFAKLCARNMQLNSSDSVEGDERQLVSSSQNSVKANEISFLDEVTCKEQIEVQKSKSYKEPTHKISGIERANIEMKQGGNKKTADCETIKKKVYRYQFADKKLKKERHPDSKDAANWEAVRCANIEDIADVIKDRGMNNVLAGRIKAFLDRIHSEQGTLDLEWLKDVEGDDAKNFLLSIRGLGLKSVECIRLLSLQQKAFPVDTNVGRICVRLGWVPIQPLPESLQLHLLELYPVLETIQKYLWPRLCNLDQRTLYELHYQMITFGKVFCTKSRPNCNACPMRCDCKHFASAFASARLALPPSTDKSPLVPSELLLPSSKDKGDSSMICLTSQNFNQNVNSEINTKTLSIPLLETKVAQQNCEPIIEEPLSPEPECIEDSESVIDECSSVDPDEIPVINLNFEQLSENVQKIYESKVQSLTAFNSGELSKALVIVSPEAASIPQPKLKNIGRLRTEHRVYELPADHPVLIGFDKADDNHIPYLLAIWGPGESHDCNESFGKFSSFDSKDKDTCNEGSCGTCITEKNVMEDTVKGTVLIPCKTATRGSFPLNGTYFQVNEVFADHETSLNPVEVPRSSIWNLARRVVYFGTSVPTIFRGLTAQEIQISFWKGSVCVRGFDRKSRAPRPLAARLHLSASKISRPNKQDKAKNDSANLRK